MMAWVTAPRLFPVLLAMAFLGLAGTANATRAHRVPKVIRSYAQPLTAGRRHVLRVASPAPVGSAVPVTPSADPEASAAFDTTGGAAYTPENPADVVEATPEEEHILEEQGGEGDA